MLRLEIITENNLNIAKECYHKIFSWLPVENDPYTSFFCADAEKRAEREQMRTKNCLVYDDEKVIGITGSYCYPFDSESGWLGWFGVLPEMRGCHYGAGILGLHEDMLREQGYKYSRLYTETYNNDNARNFYEKNGYTGELYNCPDDQLVPPGFVTIYSKALGEYPLPLWDNRNMMLSSLETGMVTEEQLKNIDELLRNLSAAKHE